MKSRVEIARKQLEAKIEGMRQTFERDVYAGRRDAQAGIYDKWYRHHRQDDGAAYDAGWMDVYFAGVDKEIQIIEG